MVYVMKFSSIPMVCVNYFYPLYTGLYKSFSFTEIDRILQIMKGNKRRSRLCSCRPLWCLL